MAANYLDNIYLRQDPDKDYLFIKVDILVSEFVEKLRQLENDKGVASVFISERRKESPTGISHNIFYFDKDPNYKPPEKETKKEVEKEDSTSIDVNEDDLPF